MRHKRSLVGTWQFQLDPQGEVTVESLSPDRTIPVPLPWQAAFPELLSYSGYAWYRCSVDLTDDWLGGEVLLHFGAVDYWSQVFVNGQLVGEHEGGYTPFTLPIRHCLQSGPNEIAVRVYDAAQSHLLIPRWPNNTTAPEATPPPYAATHIPHGKQEWYVNVGGIWQDVVLSAVPATYIAYLRVTPDVSSGEACVLVELAGVPVDATAGELTIAVRDSDGHTWEVTSPLVAGKQSYENSVVIPVPQLWSTDDPYLYTVVVGLCTPRGEDQASARFGFREIATRDGQLLLNGEPIFLLAALDQDLYPDTVYTVPSDDFLRDQFQKARHLGFNCLRCHIKPPDPRYLDLADEMGLLVWAEVPSWRTFYLKGTLDFHSFNLDDATAHQVERTLEEMIRRDFNHPSLVIWTIVNEDWGTSLPLSASDRVWVAAMYERCKQLDPTRLVVDNSACGAPWGPNIHVKSDLDDFHMYAAIPDQAANFEQAIEQFNLRPLWTYSSQGDAHRTGREPLVLSEFGNWGLPSLKGLREHYGGDPPWFGLGPWWSPWEGESGWPGGAAERFKEFGLDAIWRDYEAFATATQWHQFAAMRFEIEVLRRQPSLAGYVVTELADIYWESNGLLDFLRHPKAYHDVFGSINALDVVIPRVGRYAYWDDERVSVRMHAAHYSHADWSGAQLDCSIGDTNAGGKHVIDSLERADVKDVALVDWSLPHVEQAQAAQFHIVIKSADGAALARNTLDLLVLPARARVPSYEGHVAVLTRHGQSGESGTSDLEQSIRAVGYRTTSRLTTDTQVAVTNYPNADLLDWVRAGGDLLFLSANGPSPFFWTQRRTGAYAGNWTTSFSWLRLEIHPRLEITNPLGLPFMKVMPTQTILGLPVSDPAVQTDFLAGMVSGWVRHPAIHTVQFRYGRGRVIMTTFALEAALPEDPIGVAILHDLIDHLRSDACQPILTANYER